MPTYVYECSACMKTFEVEQRITEDPLKDCSCGGKGTLKRLIQPIAVMFKGSGFHINDYAPKGGPAESKTAEDPKPTEASKPAEASSPAPAAAAPADTGSAAEAAPAMKTD